MYTIDKTHFGSFVAALRREQGLTQKELADCLHITDKAVSKWETGASLPDTALLLPLAEALGVTVTELLLCRRQEQAAPLDASETERAVQTALGYADSRAPRTFQQQSRWPLRYLCAALLGIALTALCAVRSGGLSETLAIALLFALLFGAYFCCFAKTRLPAVYDRRRMDYYTDGPLRLHLPGVAFNNRNWPRVLRAGRVWSCCAAALYPLLSLLMSTFAPALWHEIEKGVLLVLLLGGLFLPIYLAARE